MRLLIKVVLALILLPVLYLAWTAAQIWQTSKLDERPKSDAIIVMGAAQYDGRPSAVFQSRLDHARTLYDSGVAPLIVVLGGKREGDRFTEAQAGAAYLEKELPVEDVTGVKAGNTTLDSLKVFTGLAQDREIQKIVIVSDPLHLARSKEMAGDLGFDVSVSASKTPSSEEAERNSLIRETFVLTYYRIFRDG
ncbi:MAG: YdcF family protein [Actinobacteria bacterium]|nr:YdcF family protein [Actinomycetota bacterium]